MTVDEFHAEAKQWLATARHPRWQRPYTELVYEPMLEVLRLFRANGYKTYIVTGGGQDFVRVYSEQVYGIPREQIIGTAGGTSYGFDKAGRPELTKDPKLLFNDNFAGKPEGIHLVIGRRCWCCTTMRHANTPTVLLTDCPKQRSAPLPRRSTTRPSNAAGSSSA
jgi:hypothetical protein